MTVDDVVVERSVELDASTDEVWDALTDPHRLSAWVGGAVVELDLRPGGRGTVRHTDGATRRLTVESVEASSRLVLRWWPFEGGDGDDGGIEGHPPVGSGTRVEFRLEPMGRARTLLRVREFPPPGGVESPVRGGRAVDAPGSTDAGWSVDAVGVEIPPRIRPSSLRAVAG